MKPSIILLFALAAGLSQAAESPLFSGRRDFALPGASESLAAGDFNGDGRPDVAVGVSSGGVAILLNSGNGQYGPATVFAAPIQVTSIGVADLNRDGKLDLVIPGTSAVNILYGNGDGTFQPPDTISIPSAFTYPNVAVGDINGDGNADIAVAACTQSSGCQLGVLLGNGNGTFQPLRNTLLTGASPTSLLLADFNADGNADAVIVDSGVNTVSVLLSKGDGTFQLSATIANYGRETVASTGDFNKDGALDLVLSPDAGSLAILLGNGNGTFQPPLTTLPFGPGSGAVAVGDLNGDGNLDVFTSPDVNLVSLNGWIWLGNGDGTFQLPSLLNIVPPSNPGPGGAAIVDMNGDGKKDILLGNLAGSNNLSLYLGNGDGTVQAGISTRLQTNSFVLGDFNRDGKLDVVAAAEGGLAISLGLGNGAFAPAVSFGDPSLTQWVLSADFNGDGNPDLAAAASDSSQIQVLLSNGNGTFNAAAVLSEPGRLCTSPGICDINGDGKPDIVSAGQSEFGQNLAIFVNLGSGTFGPEIDAALGNGNGILCKDLNGDGLADVVYVSNTSLSVGLGGGNGTFTQLPDMALSAPDSNLSIAGDLNGDGKPDLVINSGNGVAIYLGNGDGTFRSGATYPFGPNFTCSAMADFNGDGMMDLGCFNYGSEILLLGNGDGTFQEAALSFGLPSPAQVGDFNADGKPDLIAPFGLVNGDSVTVLLNTTPTPAPTANSVTPASGSGSPQLFSFSYSDPKGAADIGAALIAFRGAGAGTSCLLLYAPATQTLYLYNDADTALLPGIHPGSGTTQNSQCGVNGAASSATASGDNLTINLSLSFQPAFYGKKGIFMRAISNEDLDSGFQIRGSWTGATDSAPVAVSVTPNAGGGLSHLFQFVFSDPNGAADIATSFLLLNTSVSPSNGCLMLYSQTLNRLYLLNDAGSAAVTGTITPGGPGSLSNSQCAVSSGGTISRSGVQLSIPVNVTFSSKVTKLQYTFGFATDNAGESSAWTGLGYWAP